MGAANQAGEDNRDVARMAALLAGLPVEVPGVTVNRLCASGLEAVNQALGRSARARERLYLAGGVESMSRAPWVLPKPETRPAARRADALRHDAGLAADQPADGGALLDRVDGRDRRERGRALRVSREDQDRFALQSHQRAVAARAEGRFAERDRPIDVPPRAAEAIRSPSSDDEGPREDSSLEKLSALKPAFRDGGTVTAGTPRRSTTAPPVWS